MRVKSGQSAGEFGVIPRGEARRATVSPYKPAMKLRTLLSIALLVSLAACGRVRENPSSGPSSPADNNPKGSVKLLLVEGQK